MYTTPTTTAGTLKMTDEELKALTLADLIGIPYKDGGRDLAGLDCYGLAIIAVYLITGKKLRDVSYTSHDEELSNKLAPTLNVRKTAEIKAGNIIEMTFNKEIHIGVIINAREFIHATYNMGVKLSQIKTTLINNIYEVVN
mgnify:CR=1 FL=1